MREKLRSRFNELRVSLLNDGERKKVQLFSVYLILALVSAFMTVVNVFTQKYALMLSTLIFTVANLINLFLSLRGGKWRMTASILFSVEITVLFLFFIVSGEPEGFSAIWVCMVPASGLLLFGKKRGTALCAVELGLILFFFYLPFGRSLLRYPYTASFLLRFPMLYIAFFAVAFLLETIREATYDALQESRRQYIYLYAHDALTNVYNRYGFNEQMDALLKEPREQGVALLILDIDYFKNVNDRYGHTCGDVMLNEIAALLVSKSGADAVVCRWGGEEFSVILPNAADCGRIAEEIQAGIRGLVVSVGQETARTTASIGMVVVPPLVYASPAALVTQADRCLYKAKEAGRDRIVQMPFTAAS